LGVFFFRCKGDGDPVDVIDIGTKVHQSGEVVQVKILGNLAMIDEGQTDWKVVSIDATDSMAHKLSDISDVDVYMPELIKTTIQWFKVYKVTFQNYLKTRPAR
jgi:inorganic pyrophosphatase